MSRINRFIRTALTYFAGNILSKLVTFFLIPLYTNRLSPEDYGNYDLITTIIIFMVSVAFFQIWDGMFRFSFDCKDDAEKYNVISDSLIVFICGIALYCVLLFALYSYLKFDYLWYVLPFGIMYGLQYLYSFMARVFLRNSLFVFSGTANSIVTALCNILLILRFDMGVRSLYIAQIIGCMVQIVIIEIALRPLKHVDLRNINTSRIVQMIRFSGPLCVATVSYWLLSGFTKVIINQTLGSAENGIYAIASTLANITIIAVNIFQFAWNETAYMMADESNRKEKYCKCSDLLFVTVAIGCAGICIGIKILFPIMVGDKYASAYGIIPLLMIGVSANAIAGFLGTLFMTEKSTSYILSSTIIAATVNLSVAKQMTAHFGLVGAVMTLSASFMVLLAVRMLMLNKVLEIKVSAKSFLTIVYVAVSLYMYYKVDSLPIMIIYCIVLVGLYYISFTGITGFSMRKAEK